MASKRSQTACHDYESAELQARSDQKVKHSKSQVTNPECIQIGNEARAFERYLKTGSGKNLLAVTFDSPWSLEKREGCNLT
jgi:hypothetical protein